MKNKILLLVLSLVLITGLVITGCAAPEAPAPAPAPAPTPEAPPKMELRMNGVHPPGTLWTQFVLDEIADMIGQAIPRANITTYPGSTVIPYAQSYTAVQDGVVDWTLVYGGHNTGVFPIHEIALQPMLFSNIAVTNMAINELSLKYPDFHDELSNPAVEWVGSSTLLKNHLHTNKPITTLADLKGLRLGVIEESMANVAQRLGAVATVMPAGDLYTPVERGVVDGLIAPWGLVNVFKLYEVTNYHTTLYVGGGTAMHAFFNQDKWGEFTPEEQRSLKAMLIPKLQEAMHRAASLSQEQVLRENIFADPDQHMLTMSPQDLDKMSELLRPMWDEWANQMEDEGHPGRSILEDAQTWATAFTLG